LGHLRDIQSGRKAVTVTIQAVQETLLGTPETLPTSEPGTPQISYTVASGDLPTFDPAMDSKKWIGYLVGAGKAVTAATISWRMKKNGSSVNTSTFSVAANQYYTGQFYFLDVAVGDVLAIALWSNRTDSNWDYKAYQIHPTRVLPKTGHPILMPLNITALIAYPTLTLGNPNASATYECRIDLDDLAITYPGPLITTPQNFAALHAGPTYGFFRAYRGDITCGNTIYTGTHASYRPLYQKTYFPTSFVFRATEI